MSQALYRKWRPQTFADVIGQEHITHTLQNSVAANRVGHAYLFCGPRGTGKTTSARLLAKAINCLHEEPTQRPCGQCRICQSVADGRFLDLVEIDAASNTGVDDIRELRDKINFAPSDGRFKVYIIDEVHMLSAAAFNALLKTLEEPPPHVKFVLATTEEHKVPITIKSRCQQFNFRLLTEAEIRARLQWLAEQEEFTIEPEALAMIARQGAGSLRDAESLLDQLVLSPGDVITAARTQSVLGVAANTAVIELVNAWLNRDGKTGLTLIHQTLAVGTDARQFCRQMVAYLRQLLLMQAAGAEILLEVTPEEKAAMLAQAQRAPRPALMEAVKKFNEAALTPAASWQPQLPLELAFMELLPGETFLPAALTLPPVPPTTTDTPATTSSAAAVQTPTPVATKPQDGKTKRDQTGTAVPTLTLATIQSHWRELVNRAGAENKNLPALLNMGKPLAVEGNTAVIGFDYPIFKMKFDDTRGAAQLLGSLLSDLAGQPCTIRAVHTNEYTVTIDKKDFAALADELGGVVSEDL
jgi:DNA polymerase-3 subunit gamma/tau